MQYLEDILRSYLLFIWNSNLMRPPVFYLATLFARGGIDGYQHFQTYILWVVLLFLDQYIEKTEWFWSCWRRSFCNGIPNCISSVKPLNVQMIEIPLWRFGIRWRSMFSWGILLSPVTLLSGLYYPQASITGAFLFDRYPPVWNIFSLSHSQCLLIC